MKGAIQPQQHNGRGSLVLALSLPGILEETPRVRKATGTTDRREFQKIAVWILELYERGQQDVAAHRYLRHILKDKTVKLVDRYHENVRGRGELGVGRYPNQEPDLRNTLRLWLTVVRLSPLTQRDRLYWLNPDAPLNRSEGKLLTDIPLDAPISALLTPLSAMRQRHISNVASRRQYERARAAVMAFYRDLPDMGHAEIAQGVAQRLHADAKGLALPKKTSGVALPTERKKRKWRPFSPDEARQLAERLGERHGAHLWALFVTGMGPREYFGEPLTRPELFHGNVPPVPPDVVGVWEFDDADECLAIHGTKREARERKIPIIWREMPRATTSYSVFVKALRGAQEDTPAAKRYQPYDLRRGFAVAMVKAGLTRSRRLLYLGHEQESNQQNRYEQEAEDRDERVADAKVLRRYLGRPPIFRH